MMEVVIFALAVLFGSAIDVARNRRKAAKRVTKGER